MDSESFYKEINITEFCKKNNIKYKIIKNPYRKINPIHFLFSIKIINYIKKFNPDIYYFEQFSNPYLTLCAKTFIPNNKIVVSVHDVLPHQEHSKHLARIHKKIYLNIFNNYQVFSKHQAKLMREKFSPKKLFTIPLNLKDFGEPPKKNSTSNFPNFLFFGKIHYYKGLDILISAVNKIPKKYKFKITIAGVCNNFKDYKDKIENDAYDYQIRLIENEEIPKLFSNHHYLILPYRDVTQSGPLHIAYFYNIPVIASNLPGFREYIDDKKNGYLFTTENPDSLAKTLIYIIENHKNNFPIISENLNKFVRNKMSKETIGNLYIQMFNEILK